jgi:hypothetical protein
MNTVPFAATLARNATARHLVGAGATDPVVAESAATGRRSRTPRTRAHLSALLHRAADAVAPAEYSPAR